jgi:hypothetical protein
MNIPSADANRTLLETTKIGHTTIKVYFDADDIYVQGGGLKLHFPEKPNAPINVITHDSGPAGRLYDDEPTRQELIAIGERWRRGVHARIRSDWGEECFSPDKHGSWQHPLFESSSSHFSCQFCDGTFPGAAVADALWHCPLPDCDGSPMDIHSAPSCPPFSPGCAPD